VSYQAIRGAVEKATHDALRTAGVAAAAISFDNYGETSGPADETYAVISLAFDQTADDVVGCEGVEDIRGSINCLVYTPKQQGSKPGEDIALEVIKAWVTTNQRGTTHPTGVEQLAFRNMTGPSALAPDQRPHHVNAVTAGFIARAS